MTRKCVTLWLLIFTILQMTHNRSLYSVNSSFRSNSFAENYFSSVGGSMNENVKGGKQRERGRETRRGKLIFSTRFQAAYTLNVAGNATSAATFQARINYTRCVARFLARRGVDQRQAKNVKKRIQRKRPIKMTPSSSRLRNPARQGRETAQPPAMVLFGLRVGA